MPASVVVEPSILHKGWPPLPSCRPFVAVFDVVAVEEVELVLLPLHRVHARVVVPLQGHLDVVRDLLVEVAAAVVERRRGFPRFQWLFPTSFCVSGGSPHRLRSDFVSRR